MLLLQLIYAALIAPLMIYAMGVFYLVFVYFRPARRVIVPHYFAEDDLPLVTVQLPLYNERYVVGRLLDAVVRLDYPRDRLHIQVLDDSTDETTGIAAGRVRALRAAGVHIDLLHRTDRAGFKGGALGEALAHTEGGFVAIFDADFIPPTDFLRRTIPILLSDSRCGVVQGRWAHLNAEENILTRCQALMLDGHFAIEQHARSKGGLLFSFNGTGGVWRRAAIEDAGGWQGDTLTEDADLSLRAQMRGWQFVFLPDLATAGEVSPVMSGFKGQQARWAKGTTQTLFKLGRALLRSPLTARQKIMAILGVLAYPIQPLGLALLLIMPLLMVSGALRDMPVAPLGVAGLAVPLLYILGQKALYGASWAWLRGAARLPLLLILSSGMALNNTVAVLSAFRGGVGVFQRTPKFGDAPSGKGYTIRPDLTTIGEFFLGVYSVCGAVLAWRYAPGLIVYFATYAVGFFMVSGWTLADLWSARRHMFGKLTS
ncbi:MAG TPA: glycosyltransferase [Aggregatilineales bacterium]|nr:glycosyltransferase [Anaerolineales bacterium]HRE47987.1 glycosyltransferase [Aggregatilineales bacterium]